MPDYIFGDSQINYLVPNDPNNTAINREGVTFKDVAIFLRDVYKKHLIKHPYDNFFGKPEEIAEIIDEESIKYFLPSLGLSTNPENNWVDKSLGGRQAACNP